MDCMPYFLPSETYLQSIVATLIYVEGVKAFEQPRNALLALRHSIVMCEFRTVAYVAQSALFASEQFVSPSQHFSLLSNLCRPVSAVSY